ncbi:hypothetical protein LN458_18550 [Xanthomonas arboricola]|uniref:hypothetical protein n=1 Tax=Xanthomonas arboricola TaxID=56448 RepID=UPI001E51437F|nr:hypothetical protein [Xanthomonas arboricola]MCC8475982.1 hypothetical protein [Xanthomonas arboricola]
MRRFSVFGTVLCLLYVAGTALCVWAASDAGGDPKGHFVLLQLPLTPQLTVLEAMGADAWLTDMPWVHSYLLLVPPFLVALYLVGYAVQWLIERPSARGH